MDFTKYKCPVCEKQFIESDDTVVCPRCGAPYHRECYKVKNKCIFPELHKSGKSWIELNTPDEPEEPAPVEVETDVIICRHCGHKNPLSNNVCERCGDLLDKPKTKVPPFFSENFYDDDSNNFDEKPNFLNIDSFDPENILENAFGVKDDEDFDGVSGKELKNFVERKRYYYIPIFNSIKKSNISRFNFANFFFFELWYFYRKQYFKGFISLILVSLPMLTQRIFEFFYSDSFKQQFKDFNEMNGYYTVDKLWEWLSVNATPLETALVIIPDILLVVVFIIKVYFAISANKGYYRFAKKKIKIIKNSDPEADEKDVSDRIKEAGGVNFPAAFCVLMCEMIFYVALVML